MNKNGPREDTDSTPDHPEFIVLADGQTDGGTQHNGRALYRVTFDPTVAECTIAAEYTAVNRMSITRIVPIEHGYVVSLREDEFTRMVRLDTSFNETLVRDFPTAYVLTAADNIVYAAYEEGIKTLDTQFETIATGALPNEFQGKHIEDIRVHNGVAYVVDDIVFPLFLFRFDVSDPAAPECIDTIPIEAVNQTLQQQWLDPPTDQWGVIQETTHMGGGNQSVYIYDLEVQEFTPDTRSREEEHSDEVPGFQFCETVCSYSSADARSLYDKNADGVAIRDVTREPPIYATVTVDETEYLASMSVTADAPDGDRVKFDHVVELEEPARITTLHDRVVALTNNGRAYCVDPKTASIVTRCDLDITDPLEVF